MISLSDPWKDPAKGRKATNWSISAKQSEAFVDKADSPALSMQVQADGTEPQGPSWPLSDA